MQAKPLTQNTWILTSSSGYKLGLARTVDELITVIGVDKKFTNMDEVATHFKEALEEYDPGVENKETITELEGYPIKHGVAYDSSIVKVKQLTEVVQYKTTENGKVFYAAGHYGIKFSNGYVSALCPKLETLEENDFIGPFKSDFDAKFEIGRINKDQGHEVGE